MGIFKIFSSFVCIMPLLSLELSICKGKITCPGGSCTSKKGVLSYLLSTLMAAVSRFLSSRVAIMGSGCLRT